VFALVSSKFLSVALLDSLDSTLGTKPAASKETLNDDMNTIPETNREYEDPSPKGPKEDDDLDGHSVGENIDDKEEEEMPSAENKNTDTVTTRAPTLKTGTGG
jgi:hypothetical protein